MRRAWKWKADEWNALYPTGTLVRYWPVAGEDEHIDSSTRSEAWELGHGQTVVLIDGKRGGVAVEHLAVLLEPVAMTATSPE